MIGDYVEEKDELAAILSDEWTETAIAWPGKTFKTPDADSVSWIEFNIVGGEVSQASIGAPGANIHRHPGIVMIMVYTPPKLGESEAIRLADLIAELYRNNASIDGLRFMPPSVNRMGVIGNYIQVNVSIPFNRDSLM